MICLIPQFLSVFAQAYSTRLVIDECQSICFGAIPLSLPRIDCLFFIIDKIRSASSNGIICRERLIPSLSIHLFSVLRDIPSSSASCCLVLKYMYPFLALNKRCTECKSYPYPHKNQDLWNIVDLFKSNGRFPVIIFKEVGYYG